MKTYITIRQIKNLTMTAQNAAIDHNWEALESIKNNITTATLKQIAFGIHDDARTLAFEALRIETIQPAKPKEA